MSPPIEILVIYGTRPEVIKLAPVIHRLRETEGVGVRVLATGQHRHLAPVAEHVLGISPDDRLDVMREGQTPSQLHSRLIGLLSGYVREGRPDVIVVQGDTTSTLAAAQAAFYCDLPVAHVEAGIRSNNPLSPFPEEMNRRLITALATLHLAPTVEASLNLTAAGVPVERIFVTGNTVLDTLSRIADSDGIDHTCDRLNIPNGGHLLLATVHRRESWGMRMTAIGEALRDVVDNHPDDQLVLPLHPNPVVRDTLRGVLDRHERVHLFDALPYTDFVGLLKCCHIVLTDSGGLQEEAPFFGKPVVVLRDETDRPEAVAAGTAVLGTTDRRRIVHEASRLLDSPETYQRMARRTNPFGDGKAAPRVVQAILSYFGRCPAPEPF